MREITPQDLERYRFRIRSGTRQRLLKERLVGIRQNKRGTEPVFALDGAHGQDAKQTLASSAIEEPAYFQAAFGELPQPEYCLIADALQRCRRPFNFAAARHARPSQIGGA